MPAIVSPELFEAAQAQLQRNKRLAQRNARGARYLLQGLTVCARCGHSFSGRSGRGRAHYYCQGAQYCGGERVCWNPSVAGPQLDDYVWHSVSELLRDPARVLDEWLRRQQSGGMAAELTQQRDEAARVLAAHQRSLKRLVDAYEVGAIDVNELKVRSEAVRARIERAQRDVVDAEQRLRETVQLRAIVTHLDDFGLPRERLGLDKLSWTERRTIIRTLVDKIEIDETAATVVYRLPSLGRTPTPRSDRSPPERCRSGQRRWGYVSIAFIQSTVCDKPADPIELTARWPARTYQRISAETRAGVRRPPRLEATRSASPGGCATLEKSARDERADRRGPAPARGRPGARPRARQPRRRGRRHGGRVRRLPVPVLPAPSPRLRAAARGARRSPRLRVPSLSERARAPRRRARGARRRGRGEAGTVLGDARPRLRPRAPDHRATAARVRRELRLDLDRFAADLASDDARKRVEEDLEEGRSEGVTGTPTLFVAGVRYDGAWDFYSMLEALERPVAARVKYAGRVFASLPASGGLVLLLAAAAAIACANSPLGAAVPGGHRVDDRPGLASMALDERRAVVLRGPARDLLPAGRSRDPARDDRRRAHRSARGGAPGRRGVRRRRRSRADLPGAQRRHARGARLVDPHRDGRRVHARASSRCSARGARVLCASSSRRWRSSTTCSPS